MLYFLLSMFLIANSVKAQTDNVVDCEVEADVAVVLDRSLSVDPDYAFMKDFANFMCGALKLNAEGTGFRLGVVTYSSSASIDINLEPEGGFGVDNCRAEIANGDLDGDRSLTNIADALDKAADLLTDESRGARPGVLKVVVFLNDGQGNVGTENNDAAKARLENIVQARIFSIGITTTVGPFGSIAEETKSIASSPLETFYKWLPDFEMLNDIGFLEDLTSRFCSGTEEDLQFSVSRCAGRKTPIGQISLEPYGNTYPNPMFAAQNLDYDPPIRVKPNGMIMTSPVGSLDLLNTQDSFSITVILSDAIDESIPTTTIRLKINVIAEVCEGDIVRQNCEYAPTAVTEAACDARADKTIFRIPHPDDDRWFIFCDSQPAGICQRCASNLIYRTICRHCIRPEDKDDLPEKCDELPVQPPPAPRMCDLAPCPELQSCSPIQFFPHPDSNKAFCQCQPGHPHGGCHLCPDGTDAFDVENQCCK